jgi:hypothetical protein
MNSELTKNTKFLVAGCLGLIVAAVGIHTAWAGHYLPGKVQINKGSAEGIIGAARKSADKVQYIGCKRVMSSAGNRGFCYARDSSGTEVSCFVVDPSWVSALAMINETSHIRFEWSGTDNRDSNCTLLMVDNGSQFLN